MNTTATLTYPEAQRIVREAIRDKTYQLYPPTSPGCRVTQSNPAHRFRRLLSGWLEPQPSPADLLIERQRQLIELYRRVCPYDPVSGSPEQHRRRVENRRSRRGS